MDNPIPERWQIPPKTFIFSEHLLFEKRRNPLASELTLGVEKIMIHQEIGMEWLSSAKKAEWTMKRKVREGRVGHGFSTMQLRILSGLGAAEMSSANNPPALCTSSTGCSTLQVRY